MKNRIKTKSHFISSDNILAISVLVDKDNEFYGIDILFKYDSSLRICQKQEALEILNIFDAKISD